MTPLPGYSDADRDQRRTRYTRVSNAQCIATFINISSIGKMGFTCAAAGCSSNSMKSLRKYPWMRDVSWVKWPKLLAVSHRWKRLIRRGGKGGLIVERRTRLCSRHFDAHAVGEGDPKYFAWNNWGNPITTSIACASCHRERECCCLCYCYTIDIVRPDCSWSRYRGDRGHLSTQKRNWKYVYTLLKGYLYR